MIDKKTLLVFAAVGLVIIIIIINHQLLRFLQRFLWKPREMKWKMEAQGIRGPPYRFLHGNAKEATAMLRESMRRPMELSHDILPRVQPHLHSWIDAYGRNFLKWHGPIAQLIVSEPALIKEILSNRNGAYIKQPTTGYIKDLLGDGLVATEGEKWVRQRKLANHAFRAENLKGMIPAIVASVEEMFEKWRVYEGKEVDLFQEFHVLASDVISRTAFGSSYIQGKRIFEKMGELATIAARNFESFRFPVFKKILRNSDEIEAKKLELEIREVILGLVREREESNLNGKLHGYGSDLLGLLVKANQETEENARITLDDIVDECKTFYFAGHETTAGLLSWTAFLLSVHTDWQEKGRKEVLDLFGTRIPTSDDTSIGKLKTMTMILNESLRLYPPVVWIPRTVARETKLGNLVLPEGLMVVALPLYVHHDLEVWGEDVHHFNPERFSEGIVAATNNTMAFLPFGTGPRLCVAQGLAMIEVKVVFSMILQRYSFTLSPGYVHSPFKQLTLRPEHGIQVMLERV